MRPVPDAMMRASLEPAGAPRLATEPSPQLSRLLLSHRVADGFHAGTGTSHRIVSQTLHTSAGGPDGSGAPEGGLTFQSRFTLAPTASQYDDMGSSVSVNASGDVALVGVPGRTVDNQIYAGAVEVYSLRNAVWSRTAELSLASGAEPYDNFGQSVAISGDGNTAVVSAPNRIVDGNPQGEAYIFTRTQGKWGSPAELSPGVAGHASEEFGYSVAISGDGNTVLVGAPGGAAGFIFERSGGQWTMGAQLSLSSGTGVGFGDSVALSANGRTALIGAPDERVNGYASAGAAEVFTLGASGWSSATQLDLGSSAGPGSTGFQSIPRGERMGTSVALSGDGSVALVGVPQRTLNGQQLAGTAELFSLSAGTWTGPTELSLGSYADSGDLFGESVGLSADGSMAFAGAPWRSVYGQNQSGTVEVFTDGSWSDEADLGTSASSEGLGESVSVSNSGSSVWSGGPYAVVNGAPNGGSAIAFTVTVALKGTIGGIIQNSEASPQSGVFVEACSPADCNFGVSKADGSFTLQWLPAGSYSIMALGSNGQLSGRLDNVDLAAGQALTGQNLTLVAPSATVQGHAYANDSSHPFPNLGVNMCSGLIGCFSGARSGSDGSYAINGLPAGSYQLTAAVGTSSGIITYTRGPIEVETGQSLAGLDLTIPVGTSTISGYAYVGNNTHPAPNGTDVEACENGNCRWSTVASNGYYQFAQLPSGSYTIDAWDIVDGALGILGPVTLGDGQVLANEDIVLNKPTAPPSSVTVSGAAIEGTSSKVPVVNWDASWTVKSSCGKRQKAVFSVSGVGAINGSTKTFTLHQAASVVHVAHIPALYPVQGTGTVQVQCVVSSGKSKKIWFNAYLVPTGVVVNQANHPLAGAKVTLMSATSTAGPFSAVPSGSSLMDPANRKNPTVTDKSGRFAWNLGPGYYLFRVSKSGCKDPSSTKTYVDSPVRDVPPAVRDLVVRLKC